VPAALIPLLAVTFVDILGFSILIPLLPYYAQHYGASPVVVGLLVATTSLFCLIASPIFGAWSDRVGRRTILLTTQVLTTIAYVLLGIGGSLAMIFFSRAIEGVSSGNMGVTQAYISDVTAPEERGKAYGLLGATIGAGFILGPALGGALVQFGYAVPFFTAAAISLITIGLTIWLLPESHKPLDHPPTLKATLTALLVPQMRRLLLIQLFFSLSFTMWVSVLTLWLQQLFLFGPSQTSLFYASSGVISVLMQTLVVGKLVRLYHERRVLILGLVCMGVGYACVLFARQLFPVACITLLWAVGSALSRPMLNTLLSKAADERQRGVLLGSADAINNFSFVLGPLVSTAIFAHDSALIGIAPAILALLASWLTLRLPREIDQRLLSAEAST
jgi:DHA1 family tetracycline resistance protein-like MFS transporter